MDTRGPLVCLHLLLLVAICHQYSAVKIFSSCVSKDECPTEAKCTYRGCDGRICLCNDNLLPVANDTQCVQATDLGGTCSDGDPCRVPSSNCRDGQCQCLPGYKLVTSIVGKWCKQKLFGRLKHAAHGEYCGNDTECSQTLLTCDANNTCVCLDGYRLATASEINADPYKSEQCRPNSFQLGRPVNITGPECLAKVTTTTPPSTTVTTTTSTEPSTTTKPTTSSTSTSTTSIPTTTTQSTTASTTPTTTTTTTPTKTSTTTISSTIITSPATTTTVPSITSVSTTTTASTTTATTTTPAPTSAFIPTTNESSPTPSVPISTTTSTKDHSYSSPGTSVENASSTFTSTMDKYNKSSTITAHQSPSTNTLQYSTHSSLVSSHSAGESTKLPSSSTDLTTDGIPSISMSPTLTNAPASTPTPAVNTSSTTIQLTSSIPSTAAPAVSFTVPISSTGTTPCTNQPQTDTLGAVCTSSCSHPGNASCEDDMCDVPRYRCNLGYTVSDDAIECWQLSALGEPCSNSRLCQDPFTTCSGDGVCECQDEYKKSDSGRSCHLAESWLVSFPVLGEECTGGFTAECYFYFEQECVNGRCACMAGLRDVIDVDMKAVYPDRVQCRNASYTEGYRERDICENMSRSIFGADLYDRAKDKIRRMQGAIIGGCIGGVVFIGLVIGVVVIIRWKRRGRRETIRDTSSMASTEGTISRYSFKIPRPFAHFLHAKDYDSSPINYLNSVYEGDGHSMTQQPDIVTTNNVDDHLYHVDNNINNT